MSESSENRLRRNFLKKEYTFTSSFQYFALKGCFFSLQNMNFATKMKGKCSEHRQIIKNDVEYKEAVEK